MRSEDEMLQRVRARAGELRTTRRRRVKLAGLLSALGAVALVVTVGLGTATGDARDTEVATVGDSATSTTLDRRATTTTNGRPTTSPSTAPETTDAPNGAGDELSPVQPPPTTTSTAPPTTLPPPPPCAHHVLSLSVTLERPTYQPGETIPVHVTLSNSSDVACWVATKYYDAGHAPHVLLHHYYEGDEYEPQYNALSEDFSRPDAPPLEIVPGRGSLSTTVNAVLRLGPEPNEDGYLRAGTWTVIANWPAVENLHGATTTFECPEPGCTRRTGASADTSP